MLIYLQLYFVFFEIGLFAFGGGYAALPLIQEYIVNKHGWINAKTMLDIVSISQMTPGPIAINSATFVGLTIGKLPGAIIATLGVVTPQIIILTIFLKVIGTDNKYVKFMLKGISITIVALIAVTSIDLARSAVFENINVITILVFVLGLILYYKGVNLIKLIVFSGIIGFLGVLIHA
ncbi:chromate transporter [Sneathia vaginalis]|jgi:hypothetical protein|uniref:Chromate transporter n=1 Tax=Sneathia vaginalis TaxID=187101 RepID=A0A0E3Z9J8_9FUSO|nr:chromate transporter [Sneathia vaginalis]AKC95225.1 hypothetical protein VC03_01375 [Sneathia vaginalis]MBE2989684.1 chromate transporter [Sneathia sp. DSM 16630]